MKRVLKPEEWTSEHLKIVLWCHRLLWLEKPNDFVILTIHLSPRLFQVKCGAVDGLEWGWN